MAVLGQAETLQLGLLGNIFQKLEKVQGALEMCQKALNDFMVSWIFNQLGGGANLNTEVVGCYFFGVKGTYWKMDMIFVWSL